MRDNNLSHLVLVGCMRAIADGAVSGDLSAMNISQSSMKRVTGDRAWLGTDRQMVVSVLDSLTHGSIDVLGLPRIDIPVEHRAAVVAIFVHPANWQKACKWLERGLSAEDLARGAERSASQSGVSSGQMFGLLCLATAQCGEFRQLWEKKMKVALQVSESDEKAA